MSTQKKTLASFITLVAALALMLAAISLQNDSRKEIKFRHNAVFNTDSLRAPGGTQSGGPGSPQYSASKVQSLGYSLIASQDPAARVSAAAELGALAASENSRSAEPGPNEALMLDLMHTAYARESEAAVRIEIVTSASLLNHPDAAAFIKHVAAEDRDPRVREAAGKALSDRQKRLVLADSRQLQSIPWK